MTASTPTATPPPAQPMMMAGGAPPPAQPMMMAGGAMPPPPPPPMMAGGYSPMQMANGGNTGTPKNPIKEFFGDINMVEAGILALGVATFLYAIYYYKFEMKMTKTGYADLNARVQKLEASESARAAKESNVNAVGKMRMRKRILL